MHARISAAISSSAAPRSASVTPRSRPAARAAAGRTQPRADEDLGDLDGVRRGALAEVVADDPQRQATTVGDGLVPAYPTDEDLVAAGGVDRERIDVVGRVVLDDHPGHGREQLARPLGRDRIAGLDVDRLGVARHDRHPDGGARDPQVRQVEDLAALRDDLPLLLGVAVVEEYVDLGQRVERDRVRVDARRSRPRQRRGRGSAPRARRSPRRPCPDTL